MKIAVIGDNCIDEYLPPENKKYVGGNAVNTAIHFVNQGIEVSYIGVTGSDIDSKIIRKSLDQRGIDISYLTEVKGSSGVTKTKIINGQKTIIKEELGAQLNFATNGILNEKQLNFLSGFDYIYYTGFTSWQSVEEEEKKKIKNTVIENLKLLNKLGNKIIFDYSENKLEGLTEDTACFVDYAFFSLADLTKEDAIKFAKSILRMGSKLAGITLGSKGAVIAYKKEILYFPTSDIKVVDTLGAGDTFIGTFMARFILGDSLEISGKKATDAAENICLQVGGWGVSI